MNDPGIKVDICPCQRNLPEQAGHGQTHKGKIGFKGYRQDSQPESPQGESL